MKRQIIKIDEDKCTGCGLCVPNCHEGALQIIDGKVRLISDLLCDGLGACIGHCPEGAITIEEREAMPYDEIAVISDMSKKGKNVVVAHLKHLKEHGETGYLKQGVTWLEQHRSELSFNLDDVKHEVHHSQGEHQGHQHEHEHLHKPMQHGHHFGGCPGSKTVVFEKENSEAKTNTDVKSELRQWPVQMHLINPNAQYFRNADVVLAADCVAFTLGNFHPVYLKGKSLAIACPKLDSGTEIYIEKLKIMINEAQINTLTIMIMEVPCCGGLLHMVRKAQEQASRKIPVKLIMVGIRGNILKEEWV